MDVPHRRNDVPLQMRYRSCDNEIYPMEILIGTFTPVFRELHQEDTRFKSLFFFVTGGIVPPFSRDNALQSHSVTVPPVGVISMNVLWSSTCDRLRGTRSSTQLSNSSLSTTVFFLGAQQEKKRHHGEKCCSNHVAVERARGVMAWDIRCRPPTFQEAMHDALLRTVNDLAFVLTILNLPSKR